MNADAAAGEMGGGVGEESRPALVLPDWPVVFERDECAELVDFDSLWARGWRHFGSRFFRSSLMLREDKILRVRCARVDLERFSLSKSQRRTLRKNGDLRVEITAPPKPDDREESLFLKHKERFVDNVPQSLTEFLGPEGDAAPCPCAQISVYLDETLIAASFLGVGAASCSAIYAVFDPAHERRRLGIYTALREIELARKLGLRHYYLGYVTVEPSCYDYKEQFSGLEHYDWEDGWVPTEV